MKPADVTEVDRQAVEQCRAFADDMDSIEMVQVFVRHRIAAFEAGRVSGLEWQTIETAPKDGTRILATWDRSRFVVTTDNDPIIVRWVEDAIKGAAFYPDQVWSPHWVTHWMPLPALPSAH